jgi:predicted GIY-YIG superfamily endonuclease
MDYKNGKIYVIRSSKTDRIYIGSTTQQLFKRFYEHKTKSHSKQLKELMEQYDDFYIELMELCPCNTRSELLKRENELIRENKELCINIIGNSRNIATKHYLKKNGDLISHTYDNGEYNRIYYLKHKDKLTEKIKCDCGSFYSKACKFNHFKCQKHQNYEKSI